MRTATVCDPQCCGMPISAVLRPRRQSSARTHRSSDARPARQTLAGSDARARACAGKAWVGEYGDPANATEFPYLLATSPVDNVNVPNGTGQYPAVMVTTGSPARHSPRPASCPALLREQRRGAGPAPCSAVRAADRGSLPSPGFLRRV